MSETRPIRSRTARPPAVRTWEITATGRSSTLWVHRTDGGKLELHYAGNSFEIPFERVAGFGEAVAEAVAWFDEPDPRATSDA